MSFTRSKIGLLLAIAGAVALMVAAACAADAEPTAVPPTAVPPTAVPPTAVPTAAPVLGSRGGVTTAEEAGARHKFIYTGPMPTSFTEAPELAALVKSGDLPPVEERLPKEPAVINPLSIGVYGGTWRRAFTGPNDNENINRLSPDHLFMIESDEVTLYPHLASAFTASSDDKVFTVTIREGVKWSDGVPLTTEDYMFAIEDVQYNEVTNAGRKHKLGVTDFAPLVEALDDFTLRFTFEESTPSFADELAGAGMVANFIWGAAGKSLTLPKHYMSQFHIDYGDKAKIEKAVADGDFQTWGELFNDRGDTHREVDRPVVAPWVVTVPNTETTWEYTRNPYYWTVDPEGQQLPYIGDIKMVLTADSEVLNLKAMAGEIDYQQRHIMLDKLPLLVENQEKGNYVVQINPSVSGAGIVINQTWNDDEEVAKWLQTADFRRALSMGIDRPAFKDTFFMNMGNNRNGSPAVGHPFYLGEEWDTKWSALDVDAANKLLDDLGLDKKDANGHRLRTDGTNDPLTLRLDFPTAYFQNFEGMAELVRDQWSKNIGIKGDLNGMDVSLYGDLRRTNGIQMIFTSGPGGGQPLNPSAATSDLAPLVADWYISDGAEGVEPTPELKRLAEIYDETVPMKKIDRKELYMEGFRIQIDQQYGITLNHGAPGFMGTLVKKTNFMNDPDNMGEWMHIPKGQRPDQFYFKDGKNDSGF